MAENKRKPKITKKSNRYAFRLKPIEEDTLERKRIKWQLANWASVLHRLIAGADYIDEITEKAIKEKEDLVKRLKV